jgi:thioredoxin-like negative regulator of GroEL
MKAGIDALQPGGECSVKTAEAIADWELLVAIAPDAPRYRLQLAKVLVGSGDRAKARQHLEALQSTKAKVNQNEVQALLGKL